MWLPKVFLGVFLPAFAFCTTVVSREPPHIGSDVGRTLITGVTTKTSDGHMPLRREVNDLKNNFPNQWNLFILGLSSFQLSDETLATSFYEIAGIHGRPFKVWEGAEFTADPAGYCPHSNTMFLGWHRPYLALFEQELYKQIESIVLRFPFDIRDRYVSAAEDFRIPYWDWALGESGTDVPDFFVSPTIQVTGTDGLERAIPNPLHHYDLPRRIKEDFVGNWAQWNTTLRWPTSNTSDAVSQNEKFIARYRTLRRDYHDQISSAFDLASSMNAFSSRIENVHGWVHFAIGSSAPDNLFDGHMWPTEYSAFEPLLWLHHSNVDRLWALWQAAHPDVYFESAVVTDSHSSWLANNSVVDANTPLLPFWHTPDTFWTPNLIRDTTVFNYAYPETQPWNYGSDAAYRAAVNASISKLYSNSVRATLTTVAEVGGTSGGLNHLLVDNTYVDWIIRAAGSTHELPNTFQLRFYLVGDSTFDAVADVGQWTMIMSGDQGPKIHRKRASTLEPNSEGTVSLTAHLVDQVGDGKLKSLNADHVVPYLKEKLIWKLIAGDGTIVPHTDVPSLTVEVFSTTVRIPEDSDVPVQYNDGWTAHPEIILGKESRIKR